MFYSQFILAKKGPLGTIWIAAHLERKLRKNQVADTDIGVSVDSILSPDVPIALRLSSHLLLGVVRIYSKKVNYLFDDCSEALLKVKQAFRSTVVDLPPEESKAPYHSITLPETFDLDDFELPDTEVFQGNFVDHHVSTKEQITLQDTMDGVVYSTSQFGLDERFGDGDASQIALDLDEELLLNKGPSGHGVLLTSRADPQTCVEPSSSQRSDELDEEMRDTSQDVGTNCFIEAGSPSTAQPMEIGVSSDIAHLSGKDDVFEPSTDPNPDIDQNGTFGKSELDGDLAEKYSEECGEAKEIGLNESIVSEQTDHSREKSTVNGFYSLSENLSFVDQSLEPAIEAEDKLDTNSDAENKEGKDLTGLEASEFATEDAKLDMLSAYEPLLQPCNFPNNQENTELDNLVSMPNDFGIGSEEIPGMQDAPEVSVAKVQSCSIEAEGKLGNNSNAESEGQDLIRQEASEVAIVDPKADMLSVCKPMLEPCNIPSSQENAELINLVNMPKDVGIGSEEISRMQDAPEISVVEVEDVRNQNLNKDHSNMAGQPVISENILSQKGNDSVAPELPSPEKMLSLPDVPVSQSNDLLVEITPGRDVLTQGDQDATMNKISGKKRSLTESTITLQSQNSVDTSEAAQSKRSVNFVPDDDDLLSSILVGRRSTVLKVKSTPPVLDLVPSKRPRVTPRSGAHKRKVLVDDSMVLHGDTIRQQLLNTEDIRRVRKKAPSTHPEIWILQKRCLEDEMFHVPILTGFSPKLISLHCQPYDLSEAKLIQDDGSKAQSIANDTILTPKRLTVDDETEFEGTCVSSVPRDENGLHSAVCPFDTPAEQSMRVSSELFGNTLENEMMTNSEVGHTPLHFDFSENRTEIGTECRSPRIGDDTTTNSEVGRTPLQFDISENRTEMETECRREAIDDENNHPVGFGIESSSCFPCASQNDTDLVNDDIIQPSSSKDINDADFSKQVDGSCLKLDEQSSGKDPSLIVDTSIEGIHFGEGVEAAFREIVENGPEEGFLDVGRLEDADSFVPVVGAQEECSLPVNDENTTAEDRISDEGRIHELGTENKDEFQQSDLNYDEQREDFKLDPSDPAGDVFDHDTDFLNFDDDEIAEDDENTIPNAEGPQILDNSGWSTRTRAVANYLQVLFHKEAQHGRTVLRLDNLLVNKSRKEASRMFFETLVLKTRDYINVDQEVPFGNINIKPRARLLKSEF